MYLELNLKMLMTKMGVTPANELPSPTGQSVTSKVGDAITEVEDMDVDVDEGQRDLGHDFTLTEAEFDGALEDCTRARDGRVRWTSPPRKDAKIGSTPKN